MTFLIILIQKRANLSENYFINRQDRYILIKNCPELANYLEDLINVIASNSYLVSSNGDFIMANDQPPPTKYKNYIKVFTQHFKLFVFTYRQNSNSLVYNFFYFFSLKFLEKNF